MKDRISRIRENMEKLLVVSDMYDELLEQNIRTPKEAEEARLKYEYLKKKVLKLSAESRTLVRTTEKEDKP